MQFQLIRDAGLEMAIRNAPGMLLGVSAGAINMAVRSLDTKESPEPYAGLGLANITVKPHFDPEDKAVLDTLLSASERLPICAMADDSAIFVSGDRASIFGDIHWIDRGRIGPLDEGKLPF